MERLKKYKRTGSFRFYSGDKPADCFIECNVPKDGGGIYTIYGIKNGKEELVYIGSSGILVDGQVTLRKDGGMWGRIVRGRYKYKGAEKKVTRYVFWSDMQSKEEFESLIIKWFAVDNIYQDCPESVERSLIEKYQPRWNVKGIRKP